MLAKLLAHKFLDLPWPAPESESLTVLVHQNLSLIVIGVFWIHRNISPSVYPNWLVSILSNSHQSMKSIILLLNVPLMNIRVM